MNKPKKILGFTLIELLIALVVISIILAFAIPSFRSYVRKSHRAEGTSTLNSIQLQQEKYKTYHNTYSNLATVWGGVTTTPSGYYTLAITNPTATSYTVTATGVGDQANDTQAGVSCRTLTLTVNGLTTTQTPTACWTR